MREINEEIYNLRFELYIFCYRLASRQAYAIASGYSAEDLSVYTLTWRVERELYT